MHFELTQHARDALARRQIRLDWVERALREPRWIEADAVDANLRHHLLPIADFGHRVLRVIVDPTQQPWRVITAFFDRRISA